MRMGAQAGSAGRRPQRRAASRAGSRSAVVGMIGLAVVISEAVEAAPITFVYEGIVTHSDFSSIPVSSRVYGYYTFDDGLTDLVPESPNFGAYSPADINFVFTDGSSVSSSAVVITIQLGAPDLYRVEVTGPAALAGNFEALSLGQARLWRYGFNAFIDDSLPLQPPDLALLPGDQSRVVLHPGGLFVEFQLTSLALSTHEDIQVVCDGFEPPFDVDLALKEKVQRAIPLKMRLYDDDGWPLGPLVLDAAPVVNVRFTAASGGEAEDLTDQLASILKADSGNNFRWDEASESWVFNLGTKPYTSLGTYVVSAAAGDASYQLSPTCSGSFTRVP
jgi:hypothetical protein